MNVVKANMWMAVALAVTMFTLVYWCIQKSDFFIDEIATYGLSNSYYAPFIGDTTEDGSLINKVITKQNFVDYLTTSQEDSFKFDSVYFNQTKDTQPPLHYFIIHFISSFFPGSYSKWIGLSVNIVLYFFTLIVLYKFCFLIYKSKKVSSLALIFYGLSYGGLSTALMIRMYLLLTFLTVCLAYTIIKLMKNDEKRYLFIQYGILLFLGLMTQYFFVVFAFFLSALFFLRELIKCRIKETVIFTVSAFVAIGFFLLVYPSVFNHLFADKLVSGQTAVSNMTDIQGMRLSVISFILQTIASYKLLAYTSIIACFAGVLGIKKITLGLMQDYGYGDEAFFMLCIASLFTLILTAMISPVTALRYVYNILPFFAIAGVYIMQKLWCYVLKSFVGGRMFFPDCALILCVVLCLYGAFTREPMYVENICEKNYEILQKYASMPCIYLNTDYDSSITYDMLELMEFKEIFVTDDFFGKETTEYLSEQNLQEGFIIYIDVSNDWGSGIDSESVLQMIKEKTDLNYTFLMSQGFSETYWLYGLNK